MRGDCFLKVLGSVFLIIYVVLFNRFVAPLVSSAYGDWAGMLAAMLFAFFAIGCAYCGKRFWHGDKDNREHH